MQSAGPGWAHPKFIDQAAAARLCLPIDDLGPTIVFEAAFDGEQGSGFGF